MELKSIKKVFHDTLDPLYGKEEVHSFFFILIADYYSITRIELAINPHLVVTDYEKMYEALKWLKKQKPVQYILGKTTFFGLPFKVNKDTLIPRQETEELVAWVLSLADKSKPINILDIGTGSGCIAISLAKNLPNAKVYALDISEKALRIAKQNADLNNVYVEFIKTDILDTECEKQNNLKYDIIISNPPYVREKEKQLMKANVLENEPHLALFVNNKNPLLFYKAITQFALRHLEKKGQLFFEINEYLGNDMLNLLKTNHMGAVELKQDIFKKDRMIKGVNE